MAFTDVFGGELIFPSRISYLTLTTAVDVVLQWPTEQQITDGNVVADVIDVTTTAPSLNIDMPSASITSTGNKATFNNIGGNSFTIRDNTGGTIQTVQPGETWILVLTDNTTVAGLWTTFQLGANVAVASASALAGAGIKAIGLLLNQQIDSDIEAATPITVVDGDRAKCLIYTAGAGVANLPSAGTVGNDWFFMLRNSGSGTLAVTPPSGNIDGSSSINLDPNDSAFIFTDGTDYFTIGLSTGSTIAFDFVSLPIPGSGDFVLSGANLNRISYRFTGALTGNRKVVVPDTTQQYWCDNQTTGAFVLSIGTAAQASPPTLDPGTTAIFYSNSTEVIDAVNAVSVAFPILISQGGTGATTAPAALINLGAVAQTFNLVAGDGIVGGGDLSSSPRTFDFDLASITVGVPDTAADFFVFQDVDAGNVNRKALLSTITGVTSFAGRTGVVVPTVGDYAGIAEVYTVLETFTADISIQSALPSLRIEETGLGADLGNWVTQANGGDIQLATATDAAPQTPVNSVFHAIRGATTAIERVELDQAMFYAERAAAAADVAAFGQIWVRDDIPNVLMFTDDAGDDHQVSSRIEAMTANDTAISDTVFSAIVGLTPIPIRQDTRYRAVFRGVYNQNVGDIKFVFALTQVPNVAQQAWIFAVDASDNLAQLSFTHSIGVSLITLIDGENVTFEFSFNFESSTTTDGTIEVQFAQNTSSANVTTLLASSHLEVTELGPA